MKNFALLVFSAVATVLAAIGLFAVIGLILGWFLALLWNYVMPDLFGLPEATWSQMFILYLLVQALIGSTQLLKSSTKD
jgi:hypothetical protein